MSRVVLALVWFVAGLTVGSVLIAARAAQKLYNLDQRLTEALSLISLLRRQMARLHLDGLQ